MLLLELFRGTGSVGKVATAFGLKVISVDIEEKHQPDIAVDILELDYKQLPTPDFIWASPPCETFSVMVYRLHERNTKTAEPYSDRAKLGTKILYKTLEIIKYFVKKNPNLAFVIENPRGMMRNDPEIKNCLILNTTYYCNYGDDRTKPTDFFSNYPLYLNETKCKGSKKITKIPLLERYKIPPKLIEHILLEWQRQFL